MLLKNSTKRKFVHSYLDENYRLKLLILEPGKVLDVPSDVAQSWLKATGITEFIEPKKAKALEDENAKLKAQIAELQKSKSGDQKEAPELEALKAKADELGIKYQKNIGIAKLKEKIDAATK